MREVTILLLLAVWLTTMSGFDRMDERLDLMHAAAESCHG